MAAAERREREREERRSAILDAAERVFLSTSVGDATMDEIAAAAELSKGTLYLYFDRKDELFLAIALRALTAVISRFEAAREEGGTGLEQVERLMRAFVDLAQENPDRFRVAMGWMAAEYPVSAASQRFNEYLKSIAQMAQHAIEAIDFGKKDGSIRKDIPTARLAMHLWGSTVGILTVQSDAKEISRRTPFDLDFATLAPSFVDLIIQAIRDPGHVTGLDLLPESGPRSAK